MPQQEGQRFQIGLTHVDSYQASVSTNYNTKMQVQKHYKIHNKNPENPSANLTQTMCVNPYIFQRNWKSYQGKQVMAVSPIIG